MAHHQSSRRSSGPLTRQLGWFIQLRWGAGSAIILLTLIDHRWFGYLDTWVNLIWLGTAILAYNALLYVALRTLSARRGQASPLQLLAWSQLLLDFASITLLIIWTGGVQSPATRFYVLHMVFATLLLPKAMAYAGAAAAVLILSTGLALSGQFPSDPHERALSITQALVLFLIVYLTSRITGDLHRSHERVLRQNKRIRRMSRQVRRQQNAMIQHEKMVALGQMAAGVTHEIANPLASMDSLLQLAQRKPDKLTLEMVTTLREQVQRINQIIQQMKAFAHPVETEQKTLPLNDVVATTLEMLRFDKRTTGVKVERHLSADVGAIPVYPQALEQVLLNLMINALDAMADVPQPRLIVRTEHRDGHYLIEVTDNGHGIRPEHMRHLFEPFFTTKPVGKGTGLGLSISYSLVRRLGGQITARSEPEKGTTFTIRLPAQRPSDGSHGAGGASQNWEHDSKDIVVSGKSPTGDRTGGS